jgi:hypothetical protein
MKMALDPGNADQPDREWTPDQWEKLRRKVRDALKR